MVPTVAILDNKEHAGFYSKETFQFTVEKGELPYRWYGQIRSLAQSERRCPLLYKVVT